MTDSQEKVIPFVVVFTYKYSSIFCGNIQPPPSLKPLALPDELLIILWGSTSFQLGLYELMGLAFLSLLWNACVFMIFFSFGK